VANISILGYDPQRYYSGRGPLEAANLGVELGELDVAFRCNLITATSDTLTDYSAGHVSSKEAAVLMRALDKELGSERVKFYPGVSYRNLMLVKRGAEENLQDVACRPPHDIAGEPIEKNLPRGQGAELLLRLMRESRRVLEAQEVNHVRLDLKENPANMIWLWGQGEKPSFPPFSEKFGLSGGVISAVDLIKGLGKILGMEVVNVPGATGYYDTDYAGKAAAALKCLKKNDFVFVHVEAPDEAGHNGDLREKITAIERFDQMIVGAVLQAFKRKKDFRLLVLPDHATPVSVKTHTRDPVPFAVCGSGIESAGFIAYSEKEAQRSDFYFDKGYELMEYFIKD
jgi:2,3-bisphosphoglycerate-independent phosphoglycerate mutase